MQGPDPGTLPTSGKPVIPPIFPITAPPGIAAFGRSVPYVPPAGQQGLGVQPFDIPPPDPEAPMAPSIQFPRT